MKKMFSLMMIAVFAVLVIPFAVHAEDKTTTVDYTVAEAYEWSIPANVTLSTGSLSSNGSVSASGVRLAHGSTLTITVASTNGYKLVNNGSEIAYTLSKDVSGTPTTITAQSNTVLTVTSGSTSGTTAVTIATTSENIAAATKAGVHADTLTFTASVASA